MVDAGQAYAGQADPGTRGTLTVKERVVAKIVVGAALRVPGVVRQVGGLTRITGRDLPRADVTVGADAVAVNLYVSVAWPCRLDVLTREVRDGVERDVEHLTGLPVHELNIVVAGTAPAAADDTDPAGDDVVPVAPRTPRAAPAAMPAAVAVAATALTLAAVCARELLIVHDVVGGAPWVRNTVEWAARLHWSDWIIPVIAVSIALGAVCIALAVKPRPRTHVPLRTADGAVPIVWTRPTDIARGTSSRALTVPGIDAARTAVDRRRVTVHVRGSSDPTSHVDDDSLTDAVTEAVVPALALLETQPTVRVRVKR